MFRKCDADIKSMLRFIEQPESVPTSDMGTNYEISYPLRSAYGHFDLGHHWWSNSERNLSGEYRSISDSGFTCLWNPRSGRWTSALEISSLVAMDRTYCCFCWIHNKQLDVDEYCFRRIWCYDNLAQSSTGTTSTIATRRCVNIKYRYLPRITD